MAAHTIVAHTIVWFRRDLRIEDNPALVAAVRAGPVLPVFIWSPEEEGQFLPGRVSRWWLKQSLVHLNESLTILGAPLVMRRASNVLAALLEIKKATGATQVFYNHLYDPVSLVRDHRVKQGLSQAGIIVNSFNADLLYEPWEVNDDNGQAFTTFSGFWAKCMDMPAEPEAQILPPKRILKFPGPSLSCSIEDLDLEDELEKGSNALLARAWQPGWANADRALESFINGSLMEYAANRQKVDSATTSLLSPHLHYGEVSVRKIFHNVRMKQVLWVKEGRVEAEESVNLFLRSIGFREYSRYLSFNFPFTHERSLLYNLKFFPWRVDESYFKAWRQGRTGYPLVDAGMRELWATGWLHNQIRVIVSSFCVKFLQLPWRWGMKYFWDTLLDADLESDVLGWQYISGSLPDGHELDRIDNPQIEGYKFDPYGEYVRRWLPELSRLPTEWIHHPWDAPPSVLRAAGIELGSNYPRPIVEIAAARERLEQALAEMWANEAADKATLANGLEEGLGDTVEVQGMRNGFPANMDIDRGPGEKALLVRSPHDQMVPNVGVRRSTTGAVQGGAANQGSALQAVLREVPANGHVQAVQAQSQRMAAPPMAMQNGYDDTHSTAESTSARHWSLAIGLPVWSQYVPVCLHMRQDDSQVPLVPDLHHGVMSRRLPHAPPMVNFEATKTSSLSV
uniref:Blue-light photoreceptor n=1 Tax=Adiantum capillus-veneris TaxID=13818 RepID=O82769_ADICA|nr:blue-light photoreceptor [Adiantum capillus-veneris]BAA32811.1 blue-light photoreceptor [Adiantum capillus-veneris]